MSISKFLLNKCAFNVLSPSSRIFYLVILWLSLAFHGTEAIEDYCPNFFATPITNFENLLGDWHIHSRIKNTPGFTNIKCLHLHWTSKNLIEEPWQLDEIVHLTSIDTNVTAREDHTAFIRNGLAPGRWSVREREVDYNITMLYTNYEYSMWVQCSVQNNLRVLQVFFASRHVDEPFPTILKQQLMEILKYDYAIDVTIMYDVPQGSQICTDDSETTTTTQRTTTQNSADGRKGSVEIRFSIMLTVISSCFLWKLAL